MSKTKLLIHLVFATGERRMTLTDRSKRAELFKYLFGVLANKNCYVLAIGGIENHIHLLFNMHPSISLSTLVKELKINSNKYIKEKALFPEFRSWCSGYYAGTLSPSHLDGCTWYILNQEEHHKQKGFDDEMRSMAAKYHFEYMIEDWT